MKSMKRWVVLVICLALVTGMTGCGRNNNGTSASNATSDAQESSSSTNSSTSASNSSAASTENGNLNGTDNADQSSNAATNNNGQNSSAAGTDTGNTNGTGAGAGTDGDGGVIGDALGEMGSDISSAVSPGNAGSNAR